MDNMKSQTWLMDEENYEPMAINMKANDNVMKNICGDNNDNWRESLRRMKERRMKAKVKDTMMWTKLLEDKGKWQWTMKTD